MDPVDAASHARNAGVPLNACFDRLGGDVPQARSEFILLAEFSLAIEFIRYRVLLWSDCWKHAQESSRPARSGAESIEIPYSIESPETHALWFEFESLVASVAGTTDRLAKLLTLTHEDAASGRLDRNILRLSNVAPLRSSLMPHVSWLSYLADLRNVSLHRILLSSSPTVELTDGGFQVALPNHECLIERTMTDPRLLTFTEGRKMDSTVNEWSAKIESVVSFVVDDYFKARGR